MEDKAAIPAEVRLKILVVEDDPATQRVITRFLQNMQCEVDMADDGVEAINKILDKRFDLILMDIRLPNLDGFELISHIRAEEAETKKHIPIVAMTASSLPGDYEKAMAVGADAYLQKPLTPEQLVKVVKQVTGS
ncbi:MAG: response regulator [Deltaproteobacteria bacterium]|nr:response regulator [Deltaproteobacteria bacterium]